jgi:hypothetical protein
VGARLRPRPICVVAFSLVFLSFKNVEFLK